MKYLNSLEAYYAVGGQFDESNDDESVGGYSVLLSLESYAGGDGNSPEDEDFFKRHPDRRPE